MVYHQKVGLTSPTSWEVRKLKRDICCCSVSQSCPSLWNSVDCSTPGFPVLHHFPELAQTHAHWVSDTIQPSHLLSFRSPPAFNLSRHQGLFQWVSSSHQMAKGVELQLQHQSLQWILRIDFLYDWLVWSPCIPRDSHESSPAPLFKKHQFFGAQLSSQSNSHIHTWPLEKP